MNTPHASAVAGNGAQAPEGRSLALIIWAFVLLVFGLFAFNSTFGPTTARTINPAVSGAPRPVEFSFGSDFTPPDGLWRGFLLAGPIGSSLRGQKTLNKAKAR